MRRIVTAALIAFIIMAGTFPVGAAVPASCGANQLGDAIDCENDSQAVTQVSVGLGAGSRGSSNSTSGPTTRYVPYNRLTTGPDGQPCATTGYVNEGVAPADEQLLIDPNPLESNIPITGDYLSILETFPPCPERPRAPGQPAPVETRAMVAARYWERVPLPKPQPSIAPGRAITGKLAYLETRGAITHTYTNSTVFGPLEIIARGSYTVSWGDGEKTGPHPYEGRPWPAGQITHNYLTIGAYDIVVTEKWTATWRLDGESGNLRALQTTGRIDNFPVEQIQAVIVR